MQHPQHFRAESISVTSEELLDEFDSVQQILIMESWISLDFENQRNAKEAVLNDVVSELSSDRVLHDILVMERQPAEAFLSHARTAIAHHLIHRFGVV